MKVSLRSAFRALPCLLVFQMTGSLPLGSTSDRGEYRFPTSKADDALPFCLAAPHTEKRLPARGNEPTWNQIIEQTIATTESVLHSGNIAEQELELNSSPTASLKVSFKADITRGFPADRILTPDAATDPTVGTLLLELIAFNRDLQQMSASGSVAMRLTDPHGKTLFHSRRQLAAGDKESAVAPTASPPVSRAIDPVKPIRPRPEPDANRVVQSAIALVAQEIDAGLPFDTDFHYHTNDGLTVHIEAKSTALRNHPPIPLPQAPAVPTTAQLRAELESLVQAADATHGTGSVRIRLEKAGHLVSDRTGRFRQ